MNGMGFPGGLDAKMPPAKVGDGSLTPGSRRAPGETNGNQLQYSGLENPMDRGAWQPTVMESQRVGHDSVTKQQQKVLGT